MTRCFSLSALFAALMVLCVSLYGQGAAGSIVGAITDQTGGALAGATVTVTDVDRGISRTLTTDAAGAFAAPNLTPGNYKVRAEFRGFKTIERQNVQIEVNQELRVDLSLQPGEQTEVVNVTESVPLIETTNAELGGTLQNQVINDLPLNGRNFENLLDLRPGVTKYVGNSGWTQATNGLRPHDNFFMVDGINSNDPWMAQSMMNAVMAAGDAGTMLPIDAIDEFKTQQNPRAEYGWKPGAVVNVGIKSGGNDYHGTAYAYGRTDSWDANNFFSNQAGQAISPLNLEQYGASLGGRIIKDKLFFFGNYESQMYSVGSPYVHDVPTPSQLISACQTALGAGKLTALSAQLAGLNASCGQLSNFPGLFPTSPTGSLATALASTNTIFSGVGKIDYHINDKNSLNGLFFQSPGNGTFVDNPVAELTQQWLTTQYAKSQVYSVNWVYVASPTVVNSLRVGDSRYYQVFGSVDAADNPANYTYNGSTYNLYTGQTNPYYYGLPRIQIKNIVGYTLGNPGSWPKTVGPDSVYQFTDTLSWQKGRHSIKFGGELLLNQSDDNVTSNSKGPMQFSNLTNFFEGVLKSARITAGNTARSMHDEGFAAFIQDDWRVVPRLTLNLGLRYEITTVVKADNNLLGNFIPGVGLAQVGMSQLGSAFNGDHNNFAPRFGFAYDLGGNGKTVLRGGAGIYYSEASFDSFMSVNNLYGLRTIPTGVNLYANGNVVPFTAGGTINVSAVTLSGGALGSATTPGTLEYAWAHNSSANPLYNVAGGCGDGTVTTALGFTPQPCTIMGVARNLRTPYVETWNIGIQRALTNDLSLEVAYVGNHGVKLFGIQDLNQPQLVNGYSPGWGNPNTPGTAAYACLQSASSGYSNCSPNTAAEVAAEPYAKLFPYLGFINYLSNSNTSSYNGLQTSVTQRLQHGLSYVLGYTYSHALSESPDNWSYLVPINSNDMKQLYSSSMFDIRHHFTASVTYMIPGKKTKSQLLDGWSLNAILNLQSATPWTIYDATTDFSGTGEINQPAIAGGFGGETWNFYGNPSDFQTSMKWLNTNGGQGGIPYYSMAPGNINQACLAQAQKNGPLAVAALYNLGCYAAGNSILIPPAFGSYGTAGPNIFRGQPFYNLDMSITKQFQIKERLKAQFRVEAFNVFNRVNLANPVGGPGGGNSYTDPSATAGASFGFQPSTPDVVSSNAVLGSGGPRAIQMGLKLIF